MNFKTELIVLYGSNVVELHWTSRYSRTTAQEWIEEIVRILWTQIWCRVNIQKIHGQAYHANCSWN